MKKIAIIGAGLGGLTAGNLLARKGHRVTIFESHVLPGGYTAGFRRNGFYFESGTLSFESSGQVFKAFKDIGIFDKLNFERHSYRFISKEYDGTPSTYAGFKEMLYTAYPAEKEALGRYFKALDRMYWPLAALFGKSPVLAKALALPAFGIEAMKYNGVTMSEFTARYFKRGTPLFRRLSTLGYPEMSALLVGGAVFTLFEDYWTVKEGFQALADALAAKFRENGGTLRLASPVEKILTNGGAAVGVRCKEEEIPADVVISACDYKRTFLEMLGPSDVPAELREKIQRTAVSEGISAVYLGLSMSNEELMKKLKRSMVICDESPVESDIHVSDDPAHFEKAPFTAAVLSDKNPALAPAGKSSVMLEAATPYRWMDNWGGEDRAKYKELKSKVMETLIGRLEALFPGVKGAIEFKDMGTPRTFERFTKNTDGATSAWSWNPKKRFYKSIMKAYVTTPVENLYIGSCWATQIGGLPGAINAAYKCAKKIG